MIFFCKTPTILNCLTVETSETQKLRTYYTFYLPQSSTFKTDRKFIDIDKTFLITKQSADGRKAATEVMARAVNSCPDLSRLSATAATAVTAATVQYEALRLVFKTDAKLFIVSCKLNIVIGNCFVSGKFFEKGLLGICYRGMSIGG